MRSINPRFTYLLTYCRDCYKLINRKNSSKVIIDGTQQHCCPPYERIKYGYPLENVRFMLLSTNLAREWLQIDTDLLRIITSTADVLSGGTNIDDLERP